MNPKPKRVRTKPCGLCGQANDTLYRIRYREDGDWLFACPACRNTVADSPHYSYGGTWKSKKRH
ncbi:MAG: hypothetical protein ACFCBW_02980 [Candidatus Competibacterales bacterium]